MSDITDLIDENPIAGALGHTDHHKKLAKKANALSKLVTDGYLAPGAIVPNTPEGREALAGSPELSASFVKSPAGIADGEVPTWDADAEEWVPGTGGGAPVVFEHGSNPNAIRPVTDSVVWWIGTVEPVNAVGADLWIVPQVFAPVITTTSLGSLTDDVPFSVTLAATGTTPITWAVTSGALPAGLSLASSGIVSGSPTTAGAYSFMVTATNSAGSDGQAFTGAVGSGLPDFPTGATARWEAFDLSGADGSATGSIPNRVGGAPALAVAGGAPTLETDGGYKRVRFDGVDDHMLATLASSQPHTRVFLARVVGTLANKAIVGSPTAISAVSTGATSAFQFNAGATIENGPADNDWHLFVAHFAGTDSYLEIDGDRGISEAGSPGTNGAAGWRIAANTAATAFGNIEFAAGAQFPGALTSGQIADIREIWVDTYPGTITP